MNKSQQKLAAAARDALNCAVTYGDERGMVAYAEEFAAHSDLRSDLAATTREIIRRREDDGLGQARRATLELTGRILAKHGLADDRPSAAQRQANDQMAADILSQGNIGRNSDTDVYAMKRARQASEKIDADLDGRSVEWQQT